MEIADRWAQVANTKWQTGSGQDGPMAAMDIRYGSYPGSADAKRPTRGPAVSLVWVGGTDHLGESSQMKSARSASRACLGLAPTIRFTGWPSLKRIRVGILMTSNLRATP